MLRLALENEAVAALIATQLQPTYFETPALAWLFAQIQQHLVTYGRPPTPLVLVEQCRSLEASLAAQYLTTVEAVVTQPVVEADYIASRLTEFVKRNLIVDGVERLRALYNSGAPVDDVCRFWEERNTAIQAATLSGVDRSFFFEELDARTQRRAKETAQAHLYTFSTGVPDLDTVLDGGLSRGELGIWMAYAKVGKSHMLSWLAYYAVRALRIPVLYVVLEGGREQAEDRFESAFAWSTRQALKHGHLDDTRMLVLRDEYREMKDLLVIRGYTKDAAAWNASITDVYAELTDLRQRRGFRPRMIVIDYGDLLKARQRYDSPTQEQAAAFRDIKALCDRDNGYAIWTASQAQRPLKGAVDNENHVVRSNQIADSYEKVRCADFIGSINRTTAEAQQEKARLYAELYRSAPAGKLIEVRTDYAHGRAYTGVLRTETYDPTPHEQVDVGF
jgi:replicative DNA helicase